MHDEPKTWLNLKSIMQLLISQQKALKSKHLISSFVFMLDGNDEIPESLT